MVAQIPKVPKPREKKVENSQLRSAETEIDSVQRQRLGLRREAARRRRATRPQRGGVELNIIIKLPGGHGNPAM